MNKSENIVQIEDLLAEIDCLTLERDRVISALKACIIVLKAHEQYGPLTSEEMVILSSSPEVIAKAEKALKLCSFRKDY